MSCRAFTLLEVLIASTILSFIMIAVINANNNIERQILFIEGRENNLLQGEIALSIFKNDFEQLYDPSFFSNAEGLTVERQDGSFFLGENRDGYLVPAFYFTYPHRLAFFTTSHRIYQSKRDSQFSWVEYNVVDTERGKCLVRKEVLSNIYGVIDWQNYNAQKILCNITDLRFYFLSNESPQFEKREAIAENELIGAMTVEVDWEREGVAMSSSIIALSNWWPLIATEVSNE